MRMVNPSDLVVGVAHMTIKGSIKDERWELIAPDHGD